MSRYLEAVSLSDAKAFLNITDTTADTWLTEEISAQVQAVERYLDRVCLVQRFEERLDGQGHDIVTVSHTPLQVVHSVSVLNSGVAPTFDILPTSSYESLGDEIVLVGGYFSRGTKNVKVNYTAGYANVEVPYARQRFDFRESDGGTLFTEYFPSGFWTPGTLAQELERLLNTLGEGKREVSFDWVRQRFSIKETENDYLQLVDAETSTVSVSESLWGLLGISGNPTATDGAVTGGKVSLHMPAAVKRAVFELLAVGYQKGAFGENRYGVQSVRIDDYQATFSDDTMHSPLAVSEGTFNELARFKRWTLF